MRKKHFAFLAAALTAVFFVVFLRVLPVEVAGHRPGNVLMLTGNVAFMAFTAALALVLCLFVLVKRNYVKSHIATLKRFRHLLVLMVKRDFVTRYRRNVLGILWSLLNPILTMLVLTMVFSHMFRWGEMEGISFPVYVLSGQFMFNFFSESTTRAMGSIVGNAGIIKKVYVPKYLFPLTNVLSSLVNLGFTFLAFLFVVAVTGSPFHMALLLAPIPIALVFIFSMGVGMLLSSMNVFFRDLGYLYGIGTTLLFFLTPIMYPVDILSARVYHIIHLNPMFHYVAYFRHLALYGTLPGLWTNIICIGFALAALCVGLYAIMARQDKYILYV